MNVKTRLLRLMRVGRRKTDTRLARSARYVERALALVAVLYAALHAYPQVLFANSFSLGEITVYSRTAMPPEVSDRVAEIRQLITRSELAGSEASHRIFLCNNPWLFRLFSPVHGGSFAVSVTLTGSIFVADADVALDLSRSRRPEFNQRSFSEVAAHEITHGLIRAHLGFLGALRVEDWVTEGYSDYIAGEGSFPEAKGRELLISGRTEPSEAFQYYKWRKTVEYLLEVRGLAFDDVVALGGDGERVEAEMIAALRKLQGPEANGAM